MNKDFIMKTLQENYQIVENMGYEIVGIFLQGSQNYHLDYEGSDIDCKAIILPKFNDIILNNKPISTTHILPNTEHIDLKDIRLMFECFRKQNINFVEILFTEYKIMNPKYADIFQPIFDSKELIARYNNYASLNCIVGTTMEKFKALEHPYPATKDKIDKYGYDPKQLHHIMRLNEFIKRYIQGEKYKDCLISKDTKYLINVKKGLHTLDEAREIADRLNKETYQIKQDYMENNEIVINHNVEVIMNTVLLNIFKKDFHIIEK